MNPKPVLIAATLAMALSAISGTVMPGTCSSNMQNSNSGQASDKQPSKEQIEKLKEQNDKAIQMNALIDQVNTAINARNWKDAADGIKQLVILDPTRWEFYNSLQVAQLNLGQYQDSIDSGEKGIEAARTDKRPDSDPAQIKANIGQMLTNEGNSYLKLRKNKEAIESYTKAAAISPNPGLAYFNLCATQYNMGDMDGAVASCNNAISADPKRADAYFIKGSAMYGNGKLNAKGEYEVPPGTIEALKKYLELSPNGSHVDDVKEMLKAIGIKPDSTDHE